VIEDYLKDISPLIHSYATVGFTQDSIKLYIENHEKLTPSILSKFPPSQALPESLTQFCFPWGSELISSTYSSASCYSFILANDDGSSLYCTCHKTYIPIHQNNQNNQKFKTRRMSIKTSDPLDLPSFDTCTLYSSKSYSSSALSNQNSPRETESLYIPKCILLISKAGFIETFQNILKEIIKMTSGPLLFPIECYIAHLVLQVPYPPRGQCKIIYQLGCKNFTFGLPEENELPLLDINIGTLFHYLSLKSVLILFRQISTEQSIVFLSSNENLLALCSYTLLSFLFPLKWYLLYAPILPENLIDYLYSPVAFVFGMHSKYRDSVYARCNGSVLIVDLDRDKIEMNLQAVKISQQNRTFGSSLLALPVHYGSKLKKRLQNILKKFPNESKFKLKSPRLDEISCNKIRECFFQFFVSILMNYSSYLNENWKESMNTSLFKHKEFSQQSREKNCKYILKLTRTQMFANFCQARLKPKTLEEESEKLLFDDHIRAKLNRSKLRSKKLSTAFIDNPDLKVKKEQVTEKLSKFYKSQGQIQYRVFPDFNLDILTEFGLPFPKAVQFTRFIEPFVNSGTDPKIICESDDDFIYCCWIEMWVSTLWYQEILEQSQRLKELTKVLETITTKCSFSPDPLYKLILESCMSYSPSMALPVFSVMLRSYVLINPDIIRILRKVISKLFLVYVQPDSDQSCMLTNSESTPVCSSKYKKRIFIDSKNSSKQEVSFVLQDYCRNCEKELNADKIKNGWENTGDEIKCSCGAQIKPNLRVKIQIDSIGHNRFSTETVTFLNPRGLKGVLSELLSENENKFHLDVDNLRSENSFVFWNLVWHFYKANLPYDFIMPYENETFNNSYFNINNEAVDIQVSDDKECQTDWDMSSVEDALSKFYETVSLDD
jgi:DENN (AEX-3) domain/uDENN domain